MFKKFRTIYNFMFEIFLWVIYIWSAVIAIGLTYILPKQGIIVIICAIICTIIRRVVARNHKEE